MGTEKRYNMLLGVVDSCNLRSLVILPVGAAAGLACYAYIVLPFMGGHRHWNQCQGRYVCFHTHGGTVLASGVGATANLDHLLPAAASTLDRLTLGLSALQHTQERLELVWTGAHCAKSTAIIKAVHLHQWPAPCQSHLRLRAVYCCRLPPRRLHSGHETARHRERVDE